MVRVKMNSFKRSSLRSLELIGRSYDASLREMDGSVQASERHPNLRRFLATHA